MDRKDLLRRNTQRLINKWADYLQEAEDSLRATTENIPKMIGKMKVEFTNLCMKIHSEMREYEKREEE